MALPVGMNVTGWNELVNGTIVAAAFHALDTPIGGGGYMLLGFFVIISAVLIIKTNIELSFIMGLLFLGVFSTLDWINVWSKYIIIAILVFELGAVIYKTIFKNG